MRACERFLNYIKVHTTSDPDSCAAPSSAIQFDLAHQLVKEMTEIGLENAHVDEYGVVYGWLAATEGCEDKPALGVRALLVQGLATSIDALSVGFTISDYRFTEALVSCLIIGIVTFFICYAGLLIGKRAGTRLAGKAGILGGVILIAIGLEIFLTSLL